MAILSALDWLREGCQFCSSPPLNFARDFFGPALAPGLEAPSRGMATYADSAANGRAVLRELRVPEWDEDDSCWKETDVALIPPEFVLLWSEHSERHWLPSLAAECNVPKSERDFLGRWSISKGGSADYTMTSRQVVTQVQLRVTEWLCQGNPGIDEEPLFDELLKRAGASDLDWVSAHRKVLLSRRHGGRALGLRYPRLRGLAPEEPDRAERARSRTRSPSTALAASGEESEQEPALGPPDAPLWVSCSRKGFRRLRRKGGCGSWKTCHRMVGISSLPEAEPDDPCRHCWPGSGPSAVARSSDGSSVRETESSTECDDPA